MKDVNNLITRLFPDLEKGVEWKKLGEMIVSLKTGLNPRKNFVLNSPGSDIPYITGKDIFDNKINVTNRTDLIDINALNLINKRACLESGLLLFASTGTGTVGRMAIVEKYNNDWAMSETLYGIKVKKELSAKFLMYCLYSTHCKDQFEPKISKGSVPHLKVADLLNVLIPVPPLPVQEEIVRILDKFTTLEAELEAELDCRKRQYEFYRNQLLSFEGERSEGVKWMKLGEVCQIMNGKDYKTYPTGNIPVYGTGGIMTFIDRYAYDKPSVLLPRKGSIDKIYYVEVPFWTVDTIYWTRIYEEIIIPKFLYYYMQTVNLVKLNTGTGAIPSLTQTVLKKISLPVPSLEEQRRIVAILDRFESLTTDLQIGLPAEIAARRKQYEYYREQLLTFKRKAA